MDMLADLWLPIVVSAAAVWMASAMAWMLLPHHRGDFKGLPNEDALMNALRAQNVAPGMYGFPDMQDCSKMKDPAFKAKLEAGPAGFLNVMPPGAFTKMGAKMFATFIIYLIVSLFIAYLGSITIDAGADFRRVFRVLGVAGVMAYCFAGIPNAIWFNTPARTMAANLVDGIAYGLITAAIFAWLWPAA